LSIEEEQELAQIVDQASELHPAWTAVTTHGLGGLQKMFDLTEFGVWVGFVDQGVQAFDGFPDGHLSSGLVVEIISGFEVIGHCLFGVLLLVEVLHSVTSILVLAELSLVFLCIELGRTPVFFILLSDILLRSLVCRNVRRFDLVAECFESQTITVSAELRKMRGLLNEDVGMNTDLKANLWMEWSLYSI
jgi:hypothetical protein